MGRLGIQNPISNSADPHHEVQAMSGVELGLAIVATVDLCLKSEPCPHAPFFEQFYDLNTYLCSTDMEEN